MPIPRALANAVLEVMRQRVAEQGVTHVALAAATGISQPTLSRKLRGQGDLTLDETDAIAVALGEPGAEELLAEAHRSM